MIKSPSPNSSSANGGQGSSKKPKSLKEVMDEARKAIKNLKATSELEVTDPYEAVTKYKIFEEKKTALIEQHSAGHYCLWDPKYPENPERFRRSKERLQELDLIKRCQVIQPEKFSNDVFLKKHTEKLFENLRSTSQMTEAQLHDVSSNYDSIYISQETFNDAVSSAEAAITLTLRVAKGDFKNGFALIRPPGHHAMADAHCGYCFINNVAIAAEMALTEGYAKKVLIVDFDIHHGQATQQMFYDRNDVLYFSIHRYEHGLFWPHLRESNCDYIGVGAGKGYNVNVPLNIINLGDNDYLGIMFNLLLPIAYEYNPDLILISAGYDAAIGCPEGQMVVTPQCYGHLISLLSGLANGKIVACLEGGYFIESLAEGVAFTVKALLGDVCYPLIQPTIPKLHEVVDEVINNVKYFLHGYWNCFKCEKLFEYPKSQEIITDLDYIESDEHVSCIDYVPVSEIETNYPVPSEEEFNSNMNIIHSWRNEYTQNGRKCNDIIGYIYDEELLNHKPTSDSGKAVPERPERLTEIIKQFEEFHILERSKKIDPFIPECQPYIQMVHSEKYIEQIMTHESLKERPDWYFNEHTGECVSRSVNCVLSLARTIADDKIRAGVSIVRPPGHHASANRGSGFCFVNNVVIAANYLIKEKGYKKVLIVDFDIHHGNGTQDLTYNRRDIMYISVHRFDSGRFFPSHPSANFDHTGEGYNINIPFNKGTKTDIDYWTVWHRLILPIAYTYDPDFVLISAGFDAGIYDPLGGGYKVSPEMYGHLINTLKSLAAGKILLVLEGGYHLKTTALSMVMCTKALLGDPLPLPKLEQIVTDDTIDTIKNVVKSHRQKWPILKVNKQLADICYNMQTKSKIYELARNADDDQNAKQEYLELLNKLKKGDYGISN